MTWWPGWDSISDSGWWSHFWFWFGIFCLFALGVSEVISHVYGLRKDDLIATADNARISQQDEKDRETEARRAAEADAFQLSLSEAKERAAEADKKLVDLQKQQAPRRLTEQQKETLKAALSPFHGQKITVQTILGDAECKQFLEDFVAVFDASGWDHNGGAGISFAMFNAGDPMGVQILVSEKDAAAKFGPAGIGALQATLASFGIIPPNRMFTDPNIESWAARLIIGKKPISGFGYQ